MSNFGIKASMPGNNVNVSSGNDISVSSTYNTFKIFYEEYGTKSLDVSVDWTYEHNLGYKPIVFFFVKHPESGRWHKAPCKIGASTEVDNSVTWEMYGMYENTDTNTVTFSIYESIALPYPTPPIDVEYKYYILVDPREGMWYE